jgi:uncharacterized protein (DUF779 family)
MLFLRVDIEAIAINLTEQNSHVDKLVTKTAGGCPGAHPACRMRASIRVAINPVSPP